MTLGFFFPGQLTIFSVYSLPILGIVMTMTFLSVDFEAALHNIKRIHITGFVFLVTKVVIPILLFQLTRPLGENISVAVLLLSLTPFAAISPTITRIVGGDTEFLLVQQILQTLISPLYIPFLFVLIAGSSISIDTLAMVKILVFMIIIPFVISMIIRFAFRALMIKTIKFYPAMSILLIMLLLSGLFAIASGPIKANPLQALPLAAGTFVLASVLILSGWFVFFFLDKRKRLAIAVGHVYMNIGLTAVLASGFFGPEVLLFVLLYELPANLLPTIIGRIKLFKIESED
jgi:BASS family bile acid:Na+ symporter